LLFLAMTLGPALMLVAVLDGAQGIVAGWITIFGRVPLFYYIAHIYLLHASAILLAWITIGSAVFAANYKADGNGFGLAGIYTVWLVAVILLYPLCSWFAAIKRRHTEWWWSYL
jgi:hypothetical protein